MLLRSFKSAADLRLREIRALLDNDGSCPVVYDLERTFVIEVPISYRFRIAPALETGDLDEELSKWMTEEDLLTNEPCVNWLSQPQLDIPTVTDVSFDLSGSCNLACLYCFESDINSRIGPMSDETAMATLDFVFRKAAKAKRIVLHFGSGEPLIRFDLLKRIVAEANRRASMAGKVISFELTTNGTLVTREVARFLRDQPFNVRVSCDGPPSVQNAFRPFLGGQSSYASVERGLMLLLEHIPDRLTVNSVLASGTRLKDLWSWARATGIRHYNVIKVGAYSERDVCLRDGELRDFRVDLLSVCDDMFADLDSNRIPLNYQPITKVIRRLMIPEPISRFCGVAGTYLGVASDGKVYPCFRHLGVAQYELGNVHKGVDDGERILFLAQEAPKVDERPICQDCWARYLCGGGCYADSTIYGPDRLKPQVHHCPFWQTEIEIAIRFYNRLLATEPAYCIQLFGEDPERVLSALGGERSFSQAEPCS